MENGTMVESSAGSQTFSLEHVILSFTEYGIPGSLDLMQQIADAKTSGSCHRIELQPVGQYMETETGLDVMFQTPDGELERIQIDSDCFTEFDLSDFPPDLHGELKSAIETLEGHLHDVWCDFLSLRESLVRFFSTYVYYEND